VANQAFDSEALELALDRLTLLVQDVSRVADRAIKVPESEVGAPAEWTKTDRASKMVEFDASGVATFITKQSVVDLATAGASTYATAAAASAASAASSVSAVAASATAAANSATNAGTSATAAATSATNAASSATAAAASAATLSGLAGVATNGLLTRTGAGTYAARTVTGTAGQVTVTNGDGVSGDPIISLPATITQATVFNPATDTSGNGQTGYTLSLLRTLNQTGTAAYTDLLINRTVTAQGTGAQYLIDAQVNSNSAFRVQSLNGSQTYVQASGTSTETFFQLTNSNITTGQRSWRFGVTINTVGGGTAHALQLQRLSDALGSVTDTVFAVTPGTVAFSSAYVISAANSIQLTSTATSGLQLYNTADQTTNFERLEALWSSNVAAIRTIKGGTGTNRSLRLAAGGVNNNQLTIAASGASAFYTQLVQGANTGSLVVFDNSTGTASAASGSQVFFALTPTYNQSGTAAATDLLINRTQTAVGSGPQYLLDAQADGATRFNVRLINSQTYCQLKGTSTETFFSTENTGITSGRQFWRMGVRAGTAGGALGNAFVIDQMSDSGAGVISAIFSANGTSITMAPGSGVVGFTLNNTTANGSMSLLSGPTDVSGAGQTGYGLTIARTINQTGTAGYTDLLVNRTQTAAGSGTQRLLDLQVGGASQFSVSNAGGVVASGGVTCDNITANGTGGIQSNNALGGIGYKTGAGGTITQATSKVTAFTLSKVCGKITFAADALAANTTTAGATWTNTVIAAGDTVVWNHVSGGTLGAYDVIFTPGAGTCTVSIRNVTGGSLSEAPVIQFAIIKAVQA
jgi:hypothetical protein